MAFKMRGNPFKQKEKDPYTKEDDKFLEEQHEERVKREDLDEEGKKIWDCNHDPKTKWNNKTKECEPIKKD